MRARKPLAAGALTAAAAIAATGLLAPTASAADTKTPPSCVTAKYTWGWVPKATVTNNCAGDQAKTYNVKVKWLIGYETYRTSECFAVAPNESKETSGHYETDTIAALESC
ncbi:hypothetical protein [Streptomyces cinnamoneus]|nr:hypothetical protein [Streptomyces cinnamoneus]